MASPLSLNIKFPELSQEEAQRTFKAYSTNYSLDLPFAMARTDILALNPKLDDHSRDWEALKLTITRIYNDALLWDSELRKTPSIELGKDLLIKTEDTAYLYRSNLIYRDLSVIFNDTVFADTAAKEGFHSRKKMFEHFNLGESYISRVTLSLLKYSTTNDWKFVSLSSETILFDFPQFKNSSLIEYLDLCNAKFGDIDLSSFISLKKLYLGCQKAFPNKLPESLEQLKLQSRTEKDLQLQFDKIPPNLKLLDISYNKTLKVAEGFWDQLDKRTMTIVLSTDMELSPTGNADLSGITFKDQFGNIGQVQNGKVVFLKQPEPKTVKPIIPATPYKIGFKFFLGLTALVGALVFGIMKLWPRLKKA